MSASLLLYYNYLQRIFNRSNLKMSLKLQAEAWSEIGNSDKFYFTFEFEY